MTLDVAEALLSCGELRREEIPAVAADLLETGTDTATVRELAGLTAAELSVAHELLRRVLREMGRRTPTPDLAAKRIARHLASRAVTEGANLRALAAEGARLAVALDYHSELMPFYKADDEYDSPGIWTRADVDRELLRHARGLLGQSRPMPSNKPLHLSAAARLRSWLEAIANGRRR
jgi:hypothetical protein